MGLIKAYNGDMPYIFISYSHKDTDIVLQMVSQMQEDGFRVWYDEGIKPGTEWDDFIASKINGSSYFLAFLSENYLNSSNCKDEMNYARDHVENILLVYLESVSLPSGMEMRFGRSQAILAFNYEVKNDFFNKLYLSKDIGLCKGDDAVGIVEESLENIPTETYSGTSDAMPRIVKEDRPEPEPVKETTIPEIKVERVPATESRFENKKLMWIIIAAVAVLVIVLIIIGVVVASKSSKSKEPDQTAKTEREDIETTADSNEDSEKDSDKNSDEDKTSESVSEVDNTETSPNAYDGVIEGVYSTYGLSVGDSIYTMNDMDFYLKTDVPTFYDIEKQEYTDGTFYGTFAMDLMIPSTIDYAEPLHVRWIHVEPDGSERVVADFTDIQPASDEGVNWYELFLSTIDMGGEIPTGDYYVIVFVGNSEEEALISRIEYKLSGDN